MSTTAGVTDSGYVAVNQTAVVALVLGVLSAVAFFDLLLLVVPVIGIAFAIVAIRQINDSNGTQTGKLMAWGGLALSVAFAGAVVTTAAMAHAAVRGDERRIATTVSQLGKDIGSGNYDAAYAAFDSRFRGRVNADQFKKTLEAIQAPTPLGRLEVMEWNGVTPKFESAGGDRTALVRARTKFTNVNEGRIELVLREAEGKWLVMRAPEFFPEPRPQRGGADDVFNLD
jgi:hypothetical protein